MRVLFFDFVDAFAGKPRATLDLAERVRGEAEVLFVDAVSACAEYRQAVLSRQFHYEAVDDAGSLNLGDRDRLRRLLRRGPRVLRMVRRLRAAIERLNPDVVWTSSLKGLAILRCALPRRRPVLLHFRGAWQPPFMRGWKGYLLRQPTTRVLSLADSISRELVKAGVTSRRIMRVPDAVDVDRMRILAQGPLDAPLPQPRAACRLLLPGRLAQAKGHDCAVRALARLVNHGLDADLLLTGQPIMDAEHQWKLRLEQLAASLGVAGRVHFIGWRTDIPRLIAESDATILPSLSEGTPLVLLESMAIGRPVIATPVGGVPDIIEHGVTGWLHAVNDDDALAAAIEQTRDPQRRGAAVAAALRHVRDQFSPATQRTLALAAFRSVLKPGDA